MSKSRASVGALAMAFLLAAAGAGLPQTSPQPQPQPSTPAPYVLTMGDMMSTLIQPRHAKLGLAGRAQNWALAGYALVEIRQSFAGITKAQPRFRGLPVGELVDAAVSQPLDAVDTAIKQQDREEVHRRLRSTHPGLQCLPRGGRPCLRGHQSAGCVGISEPGIQSAAIARSARLLACRKRDRTARSDCKFPQSGHPCTGNLRPPLRRRAVSDVSCWKRSARADRASPRLHRIITAIASACAAAFARPAPKPYPTTSFWSCCCSVRCRGATSSRSPNCCWRSSAPSPR